jgi:hypothetical protein
VDGRAAVFISVLLLSLGSSQSRGARGHCNAPPDQGKCGNAPVAACLIGVCLLLHNGFHATLHDS